MVSLPQIPSIRPFDTYLIEDLTEILSQFTTPLEVLVILPTRRAVKDLQFALSKKATHPTCLPKIVAISDLPSHVLGLNTSDASSIDQLALCYRCLEMMNAKTNPGNTEKPSFSYVKDLLDFVDQVHTFNVDLNDLESLVPETYAEHWQQTSSFLKDFFSTWSQHLENHGLKDKTIITRDQFKKLNAFWSAFPPQTPVIAAGLDGFIPMVKDVLDQIATFENGHVLWTGVLPEPPLKQTQNHNDDGKPNITKTHPNFLSHISVSSQVSSEAKNNSSSHSPSLHRLGRILTLSHVFSNEPFEHRDNENLSSCSLDGIQVYAAPSLSNEAQMIALLAKEGIAKEETDKNARKTVAIVTPDQELSKAIQRNLESWGIIVDTAGGNNALQTPQARLLLRILDLDSLTHQPYQPPINTLSLLKNPMITWDSKKEIISLESRIRNKGIQATLDSISLKSENQKTAIKEWNTLIEPFVQAKTENPFSLKQGIPALKNLCEALSPDDLCKADFFEPLFQSLENVQPYLQTLPFSEFTNLIKLLLKEHVSREAVNHPRVRLLSPIQSAFSKFDRVILAGLNEGVWPSSMPENPWLNLDMQINLGLPDHQILLGRGAWLLAQNMRSPEVFLTYSNRRGGDPAAPSRWILRLEALKQALDELKGVPSARHIQEHTLNLDPKYETILSRLSKPKEYTPITEPKPTPPMDLRPHRYSVSDLERLIKDPYQLYAKSVLGLYPLPDFSYTESQGSALRAEFGTFVHGCLEQTVKTKMPLKSVINTALKTLRANKPIFGLFPPDKNTLILWEAHLQKVLPWIQDYLHDQWQQGSGVDPLCEIPLKTTVSLSTPIDIIGKADRIDQLLDGTYEIIDYKTGFTPSKTDVENTTSPQLALLGKLFMLSHPGKTVSKLTYVSLGTKTVQSYAADPLIESTWERVMALLKHYHDSVNENSNPYKINVLQSLTDPYNDYSHLERTSEWLESMTHDLTSKSSTDHSTANHSSEEG